MTRLNFLYIRPTIELRFIERNFRYLHVTKKKEKEDFHDLNCLAASFSCAVFSISKSLKVKQVVYHEKVFPSDKN